MKVVASALGVFVLILGLSWVATGNNFFVYKVFAPRVEQVRREVFEQSKAYNQGQIQELSNMQFQYEQAAPEHRAALRSIILRRVSDYDESRLPPELFRFIQSLRRQR